MDIASFFHLDVATLLKATGYLGIFFIVFAESGLFFGFFLPGDSLLFTAGLLASESFFKLAPLLALVVTAAILGDNVGYWFGKKVGPRLFTREDSFFFHPRHVERTREFYKRHGAKTVILARFIPIVRTYAPILAGVGRMEYSSFLRNNVLGGLLWGIGVTSAGYALGQTIPSIGEYLTEILLGIVFLSLLPLLFEWVRRT